MLKIKKILKFRIKENEFRPDWTGILTNPVYFARRGVWDALCKHKSRLYGTVLDFGSGSQPYRELFGEASAYISCEFDTVENRKEKVADIFYDGLIIPLDDCSVDCVLCTETLEHIPNPMEVLCELKRVLKPGGCILLTTPFMWNEHEQPYDFYRYTSYGLRRIFEDCGYEVLLQEKLGSGVIASAQLFTTWLVNTFFDSVWSLKGKLFVNLLFVFPVHVFAACLNFFTIKNSKSKEWYLDNLIVAVKDS